MDFLLLPAIANSKTRKNIVMISYAYFERVKSHGLPARSMRVFVFILHFIGLHLRVCTSTVCRMDTARCDCDIAIVFHLPKHRPVKKVGTVIGLNVSN